MTEKNKTTSKAKMPAPSRTRVKELAIARLEALAEKQRLRQPRSRRLPTVSAAEKARQAALAAVCALYEQRQKKEPLITQIRTLAELLCLYALMGKRRSLKPAHETVWIHRLIEREGGDCIETCPRVRETGPAIRSLDRAEALLTRLVWRGAEAEARREMGAKEAQEADASR